jgi:hypothetical protein
MSEIIPAKNLEHKFKCIRKNGRVIYGNNCNPKDSICNETYCPNHTCNSCDYKDEYYKECHNKCAYFMSHPLYETMYKDRVGLDNRQHKIIDDNIDTAVNKLMKKTVEEISENV